MSYVVSIRRSDGSSIAPPEIEALVAADSELRKLTLCLRPVILMLLIAWRSADQSATATFLLSEGGLHSTTTPSNAVLRKLQQMSRLLGARLIGEDGDDITDIEITGVEPSAAFSWGCLVVVGSAVLLAIWWWLRG